ncbi:hypothetical protein [Actinospica robiniae]|uniref:hypothetical protein n=1 Tax=Actinospica robiniae TaxID=304901 RepID=UPI00041AB8A3|nr:hypothetical protein [Actinospica robiniae]
MMNTIVRGVMAGAAGTCALNGATHLDMAVRGRPSSTTPEETAEAVAARANVCIPGAGPDRQARVTGLGALSGIAVGTGVGVLSAGLRRMGVRLPLWAGAATVAALAMAAGNLPIVRLGVSDPRSWSVGDWLSDALPHLAYGLGTYEAVSGDGARA